MWFDSHPKVTTGIPFNYPAYTPKAIPIKTVPAPIKPECNCGTRLLHIGVFPASSFPLIKDFLSAFGECIINHGKIGSAGEIELSVYFNDSRDALKAMNLLPKFPQCRDCVITPIEQDIKTLQVMLPQEISKEELWYEVAKRGDIAWSNYECIAGKSIVTYLFFDTRCNTKLLQSPLILNGSSLHFTEKVVPHNLACRALSKGNSNASGPAYKELGSPAMAPSFPVGPYFSLPDPAVPVPLKSAPTLSLKTAFYETFSPPRTSCPSDCGSSSPDEYTIAKERKGSRMDLFGQLTPPPQQDKKIFDSAVTPPTVGKRTPPPELVSTPPVTPLTPRTKSNKVDLSLISSGAEYRTTVMLRNIPNKVNLAALRSFLDETNKNTYDFLYLRMDFNNKCNVGYAFINFTHPDHIATLTRARRGKKWSQYNSVKIIDVSFANIQGRSALVDKFRDSPIMNMDPEYRPKLYHTTGKLAGEEENFP